jgi:ribosomal protein L37AE/L43A
MTNKLYSQEAEDDGYADYLYDKMRDERDEANPPYDDVRFCPHCQSLKLTAIADGTATCRTCGLARSER